MRTLQYQAWAGRANQIVDTNIDWYQQHPTPVRYTPEFTYAGTNWVGYETTEPPTSEWYVQHPDNIREPAALTYAGYWTGDPNRTGSAFEEIDWYVQHPDIIREPSYVTYEGYWAGDKVTGDPGPTGDIDWYNQRPDQIQVPQGLYTGMYPKLFTPAVGVDDDSIAWFTQSEEPQYEEPHINYISFIKQDQHEVFVSDDNSYWQSPDPVHPPIDIAYTQYGFDSNLFVSQPDEFEWYVQQPNPRFLPSQPPSWLDTANLTKEIVDLAEIDWYVQHPFVIPTSAFDNIGYIVTDITTGAIVVVDDKDELFFGQQVTPNAPSIAHYQWYVQPNADAPLVITEGDITFTTFGSIRGFF